MSPAEIGVAGGAGERATVTSGLGLAVAAVVSIVTAAVILAVVVASSPSAWHLLGAGRGLIPEEHYPLFGYALVLGTTVGQAAGWAGGSAVLWYLMALAGLPAAWGTLRLAMTVVYLGLGAVPMLVYHVLFGGWLLGLPRAGLDAWLLEHHADAHWLLVGVHPVIDVAPAPLAAVFLVLMWRFGEAVRTRPLFQALLALTVVLTSLAVGLSLAIHAALVHIRL